MEPRFFSILGLGPTRERNRTGLNDPEAHRDDDTWVLGAIPDSLLAAFGAKGQEQQVRPAVRPNRLEGSLRSVRS